MSSFILSSENEIFNMIFESHFARYSKFVSIFFKYKIVNLNFSKQAASEFDLVAETNSRIITQIITWLHVFEVHKLDPHNGPSQFINGPSRFMYFSSRIGYGVGYCRSCDCYGVRYCGSHHYFGDKFIRA